MPFLNEMIIESVGNNRFRLQKALKFKSEKFKMEIEVPEGFITDLASVPRIPIVFMLWGNRVHRESVLHDYLYRIDCVPRVYFNTANKIFMEAMKSRGVPAWIRWPMYIGVCAVGGCFFRLRPVQHISTDELLLRTTQLHGKLFKDES